MCVCGIYAYVEYCVYSGVGRTRGGKERNTARWAMYMQDVQYVAIVGKGGEKGLLLASSSFLARPPPRSIGLTSTEKRERERGKDQKASL